MKFKLVSVSLPIFLLTTLSFGAVPSNSSDINSYQIHDRSSVVHMYFAEAYLSVKDQEHMNCNAGHGNYFDINCWTVEPFDESDKPDPVTIKITDDGHPDAMCILDNVPYVPGSPDAVQHDIFVNSSEKSNGSWKLTCNLAG